MSRSSSFGANLSRAFAKKAETKQKIVESKEVKVISPPEQKQEIKKSETHQPYYDPSKCTRVYENPRYGELKKQIDQCDHWQCTLCDYVQITNSTCQNINCPRNVRFESDVSLEPTEQDKLNKLLKLLKSSGHNSHKFDKCAISCCWFCWTMNIQKPYSSCQYCGNPYTFLI